MQIAGHGRWMGNGDEWGWMGINFYPFIPRRMNGDEWVMNGWWMDRPRILFIAHSSSILHRAWHIIVQYKTSIWLVYWNYTCSCGWMGKSWSPFIPIHPHSPFICHALRYTWCWCKSVGWVWVKRYSSSNCHRMLISIQNTDLDGSICTVIYGYMSQN